LAGTLEKCFCGFLRGEHGQHAKPIAPVLEELPPAENEMSEAKSYISYPKFTGIQMQGRTKERSKLLACAASHSWMTKLSYDSYIKGLDYTILIINIICMSMIFMLRSYC